MPVRLYVIGPVTGIEGDNREAFHVAQERLVGAGHAVEIPHDFIKPGTPHDRAMLVSIAMLTDHYESCMIGRSFCRRFDGVALLGGWEQSEGARLERQVAEACGIPCKPVDEWVEEAR